MSIIIRLILTRPQTYTPVAQIANADGALIKSIRKHHQNTNVQIISSQQTRAEQAKIRRATADSAIIIIVTVNANLDMSQTEQVRNLIASGKPVIGIAAYNPYDLLAFPQLATYLVTYEYTEPAFKAVARVLFGEIPPQSRLPVSVLT